MTMGLTAAGLTQGPEGALTPSRRPSRDNSSAFEAFDAAMAQSEDAPGEGDSRSDAAASRDSDATASDAATAKLADTASNPLLTRAGDRLASRMAASWLGVSGQESSRQNASSQLTSSPITSRQDSSTPASTSVWTLGGTADSSNVASSDASVAAAASQSASPRDPLAALLASPAGQSVDEAAPQPQPQPAPTTAASPASVPTDPRVRDAAPADGARQAANAADASIGQSLDASRPQSRPVSTDASSARRTTQSDDGDAAAPATAAMANAMGLPDQLLLAAQGAAMTQTTAPPVSAAPTRSADAGDPAASSAASSATAEAVARIGAALTAPAQPRANQPAVVEREPQTVSVHVVSQQSWLPPVDPNLSGGSQPQPQSFGESGAQSQKSSDGAVKGEATDLEPPAPAWSQSASLSSFAALTSGFGASAAASATSTGIHGAEATGAAASARQDLPAAPAPTLRRDLEITMTPQDLGGLQVKLKSAGDRLELAFVADRGETARMISDKTAALETQLTGAGLGLGGVAISASAAGDMSGAQTGGQGGQGSHTPSQAFGSAQGQNGGQSGGDSESTRQGRNSAGRERQDERNERGDVSRDARGPSGDRGLYL
ncbi:flagellar hook-length control protein FliK [Rhodoblastus acidophilus]|uniref:flagellar hook-length control protein FliK n=1 Tax=Rhodoblastus acidophilus TaxID=1074 RepID=UPI002225486C|nr:flagellar hook-length control protein FliK [Rhodoblastus acidophilus]MCW2316277.1 flagellar hook-length control protein FliK [Rhodoblastus acidophilus]